MHLTVINVPQSILGRKGGKCMNKVILMGRLTADPEIRESTKGTKVATHTLAVDSYYKAGEKNTAFIPCVAFGKNASFVETHLRKGIKIIVEGKWQTGSYTNKNGEKVYTNNCFVEKYEFVESKSSTSVENNCQSNEYQPRPTGPAAPDGFMKIPEGIEEELPFQ